MEENQLTHDFLSVISNQKRLNILRTLMKGEISVGCLSEKTGINQKILSQHLSYLREANLVHTRRDGVRIYYSANTLEIVKNARELCELIIHEELCIFQPSKPCIHRTSVDCAC